jgi:hypothetical protein
MNWNWVVTWPRLLCRCRAGDASLKRLGIRRRPGFDFRRVSGHAWRGTFPFNAPRNGDFAFNRAILTEVTFDRRHILRFRRLILRVVIRRSGGLGRCSRTLFRRWHGNSAALDAQVEP